MSKKNQSALINLIVTFIVLLGLAALIWWVILPRIRELTIFQPFTGNRTVVDFHTHFNLDPNVPQIVVNSQRARDAYPPIVENRMSEPLIFLRADFLQEFVDPFLFYDEGARTFFASSRYEMLEFTPNVSRYTINGESFELTTPIRLIDGMIYVPADLLHQLYEITIEYFADYNMVVITTYDESVTTATVSANRSEIRYNNNRSSPITTLLARYDTVTIFPEYGEVEGFVRARSENGLLGYVPVNDLENITASVPVLTRTPLLNSGFMQNLVQHPPNWPLNTSVNMVWDLIYTYDANTVNRMQIPLHESLTVVSPTWFRINNESTFFDTIVSRDYVNWAHEQGVLVWPMVFDVNEPVSEAFLMDRNARQQGVNQLLFYVDTFGLDGINIDFEHLRPHVGPYKIQFLRELAIPLRERGVVLSAAVKIPIPATMFYRRDLIGLTVDFVQVMTYDEHWATSPVAGPNASLPWVQGAIDNMLLEVPAEKLIMGLPLYNRKWRIVQADGSVSQRAVGMQFARNFFEERGVVWEWDPIVGSYFGYTAEIEDGEFVVYQVWLEDERSIRTKMQIFETHNLAGVAGWSRGLETAETWDVIAHFMR